MPDIHCKAMLFDLDGVLIDSTPAVTRVWRRWALEHGFDPEELLARAHGRPSLTTVREYLPNADHAVENLFTGGDVDPAEVLTAVQKADIAFRMMMQIRNKLTSAVQEIKGIQI